MIVGIALKVAKSKTARKAAKKAGRKAAEFARENVTVEIVNGGVEIDIAGRKVRIDREALSRKDEVQTIEIEYDPFL
jgi:DNA-binding protein YbaB